VIVLGIVVAVTLVALTVAAVLGRIDGSLAPPTSSLAYVPLPDDRLTPDDLEALRLDTALRGYRMEQVDEVIARLGAEIDELRGRAGAAEAVGEGEAGMPPDESAGSSPYERPSAWAPAPAPAEPVESSPLAEPQPPTRQPDPES